LTGILLVFLGLSAVEGEGEEGRGRREEEGRERMGV
jgi:hypothetical protein